MQLYTGTKRPSSIYACKGGGKRALPPCSGVEEAHEATKETQQSEHCSSGAGEVEDETTVSVLTPKKLMVMDCTEPCEPTAYMVPFDQLPKPMNRMLNKTNETNQTIFTISMAEDPNSVQNSGLIDGEADDDVVEADTEEIIDFLEKNTGHAKDKVLANFPCKYDMLIIVIR